jgi:hypothetical protein
VTVTNTLYCTAQELADYVGDRTSTLEQIRGWAVTAASRAIDDHCGRNFSNDDAASARVFPVLSAALAYVDDFHTTSGLVIKTDTDDDATFATTWAAADYELHPLNGRVNGLSGFPYCKIAAVNTYSFPTCNYRRGVLQVTAKWGWADIPDAVFQACLILGQEFMKLKDAPFGVANTDAFGVIRVRDNARVARLLEPYVRYDRRGPAVA